MNLEKAAGPYRWYDKNLISFTDWCGRTTDFTPGPLAIFGAVENNSYHLCAYYKHFLHDLSPLQEKLTSAPLHARGGARHPTQGRPQHSKEDHLSKSIFRYV